MLLCLCKSDYKWKSSLSGQRNNVKTPVAQNNFAFGFGVSGLTKESQKECAESRSGNAYAGNSNWFFLF